MNADYIIAALDSGNYREMRGAVVERLRAFDKFEQTRQALALKKRDNRAARKTPKV